ncbi:adenylate/guanylate cyclase domain-containing protein [Xylanibacillus composti]|uniref:Adenylate/guanylate cyclase domain-containing protein n=1 Tax=Xylanibacillus composti TaxID=1572762 RepID=A0A8J4M1U9_9BACL|nr:adenylate/guanylate cyclase domain-containing protein [Xylanibacillus composti]MDT9724987.1 adenylate/guanylate cyclase domain-containing protein [Xylanibacillus composti]GIQ68227.1 adenylate/guanylate cyclase domain-containing protein [Xylanibacillus composti]
MKKRIRKYIIYGNALVVLLCFVLFMFQVFLTLERSLYEFDLKRTASHAPHEDIVVIGIDEHSLQALGSFPWDRQIYIPLLDMLNMEESRPIAIAFDILFTSASDPQSDEALARTLAEYDNIIMPSYANIEDEYNRKAVSFGEDGALQADNWTHPIPIFAEVTERAHINARLDSDGVIRRNWLQINTGDGTPIYSMAFKMAQMGNIPVESYLGRNQHKEILIDFQATSNDFLHIPFVSVLNGEVPPEIFKDRYVLIGFTAVGYDTGQTAIEQEMKLVYAHANILNQLLAQTYISMAPNLYSAVTVLAMILLALWFTWRFKTLHSVLIFMGTAAALLIGQYYIFKHFGLYVDTVNPLVALSLTYLYNVSIKAYFEARQRSFITKQFGRYLSPELVREIARSDQEIQLGGIHKELSILFLDVRGFTTLSEQMKPEEVVGFLNMMFDLITTKALDNKGTIDKFIGDAAMILYNAPLDVPNHAYCAVKTAYDIQEGMKQVRKEIEEQYGASISVGIGIHTGEVVVGNIGSFLRVDYTAIGDNVNVAARIESNTTANQVLVSEETYALTKDYFDYQCVGERMMKGKTIAVKLYEVTGIKKRLAIAD